MGEISLVIEKAFSRHNPPIRLISGVYKSIVEKDSNFIKARALADEFDKAYSKRAFVHWYNTGLADGEFEEAREDLEASIYDWYVGGVEVDEE